MKVVPQGGWALVEEVRQETGIVTSAEVEERRQLFKVLAVGEGRQTDYGQTIYPKVYPGQTVLVERVADANTPSGILPEGQYLIPFERVMAVVTEEDNE